MPDQEPEMEPETPPQADRQPQAQQHPLPAQPTPSGQWIFVPSGQSLTLGNPAHSTGPGYSPPFTQRSFGIRISAGAVALSNLVLAIPSFIVAMFFVYGDPMTPAEGWANFFVLVAIIGSLVSGIRIISKHRRPSARSTPWTLAAFALVSIINFIAMADHYPQLTVTWSVLTGIAVIILCLTDVSKTANAQPLTAPGEIYQPTFKG